MNRQRNSCLSEKGYTSCCTDPGFVSQIGVQLVSETGLHWTLNHTEALVEDTCISLRSHVWQGSVFSSFSSSLFLVRLLGPGYLQNMSYQNILYFFLTFNCCLSGFWPFYAEFACSLHTYVGFFHVRWSNWSWLTCMSCAKLVVPPLWGWRQPYDNCQEGLLCLWATCGLSNALQKWSALSKHYTNITFLKHVALALVKADKNDRQAWQNRYAL